MTGCGRHWCPEVFPLPIHSPSTVNVITFSPPSEASLYGPSRLSLPPSSSTFTKDLLFLHCIPSLGTRCMIAWVGSHRFYRREKEEFKASLDPSQWKNGLELLHYSSDLFQ